MNKDLIIAVGGFFLLCLLAPTLVEVFAFITQYLSLLLIIGVALVSLFVLVKHIRRTRRSWNSRTP